MMLPRITRLLKRTAVVPAVVLVTVLGVRAHDSQRGGPLGAMAARGERAALIVSLDALIRMSSNPFFPYLLQRMDEGMAQAGGPA